MWLDEYNELNNGEKERFSKLVNYLLNKTYLTREIYEGKQVIGKINADYRFIERYITLFEGYLEVIDYKLTIYSESGDDEILMSDNYMARNSFETNIAKATKIRIDFIKNNGAKTFSVFSVKVF